MCDTDSKENRNVFEEIKAIIIEKLALDEEDIKKISLEASLANDFSADSLDLADIMMAFEEHFGVEIDNDVAEAAQNIGDIVNEIQKLLKPKLS